MEEKFRLLDLIGLTKAEADAYFANVKIVPTLYPVVYCNTKEGQIFSSLYDLEILPYLDLKRTSKVWGLDVHGILLYKADSKNELILDASGGRLPSADALRRIFEEETKINLCLKDLMACGVEHIRFIDSAYAYRSNEQTHDGLFKCYMCISAIAELHLDRAHIRPVL